MNIKQTIKIRFSECIALFPILMTILDPYALAEGSGIYICDLFLIIMGVYLFFRKEFALFIPLLVILIADLFLTLISFTFTDPTNTSFVLAIKVAIVFLLYLIVYSSIWMKMINYDDDSFFRMAEIFGLACALLALLQFIFGSIGVDFYDGRLFLPLGDNSTFGGLFDKNTNDLRVHSFFEEPSYLAFFEIPIAAHFMQNKKYVRALVCGLSCVVSGSLIGVAGIFISLLIVIACDRSIEKKYRMRLYALIVVVILSLFFLYLFHQGVRDLINYYVKRFMSFERESKRETSSFSQRLIGNLGLFSRYNYFNKLVGVGFNQYALYFNLLKDYSNDIVSNLLNFGYIGLLILISSLVFMLKRAKEHSFVFFAIFIILLAVDHSWFGPMFFYILTWVVMKQGKKGKNLFFTVKY